MMTRLTGKFVILGLSLLSLQSCFVAKEYSRPPGILKETSFRTDSISLDTVSIAEVSWRTLFTDPYLTAHIEEALRNNIDIRVALQQIEMAQAYLKQGRAQQLPSLIAGPSLVHQEDFGTSSTTQTAGDFTQYELTADLSWEADIWGKLESNERALEADYLQTLTAHKAVKTEIIASVASLYYQLLSLDQQLEVTLETIENRQRSIETIKALKQAGTVTEVGVKQTEAQLYRAQVVAIELENNIRLLENTLSVLLGKAPQHIQRSELEAQQLNTPLLVGVPAMLLRNRPDVLAAEYDLIRAFHLKNAARSAFYPSLRINASTGFQAFDFADLLNTNALFASLAGSLTQPIFNRRQIRTGYEVAQATEEVAFLNFRRTLLIAAQEVSDALYNYEAAEEKSQVILNQLEAYEMAVEYSEELLNNGFVNYLEVLTARENALSTQLQLIDVRYQELNAIVNLYQALGGGWR